MGGKLRLGTSAFTATGWPGTFYPADMKPADFLSFYAQHFDTVEVDSTYIRWLGDRKGIEEKTKTWDKTIVNRRHELEEWAEAIRKFNQRGVDIFAFANNHYGGHAPDTLRQFVEIWRKKYG